MAVGVAHKVSRGFVDAESGRPLLFNASSSTSSSSLDTRDGSPKAVMAGGKGWGQPGLPAAFILGALLTLCVVFLTGGSLGMRWQGGEHPTTRLTCRRKLPPPLLCCAASSCASPCTRAGSFICLPGAAPGLRTGPLERKFGLQDAAQVGGTKGCGTAGLPLPGGGSKLGRQGCDADHVLPCRAARPRLQQQQQQQQPLAMPRCSVLSRSL